MPKIAIKLDAQATKQYLQQHYCTLEHLLKTCDLSSAEFFTYMDAECLPQHAYVWEEYVKVLSSLAGQKWVQQQTFYYHPRYTLLLQDLIIWHRYMSLEDIAQAVQNDFKDQYIAKLKELDAFGDVFCVYQDSTGEINRGLLDTLLDNEWQLYLQGVYAAAMNEPTADNIAVKEVMVRRIRDLTENGAKTVLSEAERTVLAQWLTALDAVVSPYAPFERADSLRQQWFDRIVAKYSIRINF